MVEVNRRNLTVFMFISSFRVIPHTNLILVMLSNATEDTNQKHIDTEPQQINFDSPVCHKVSAVLSRRRPAKCCSHDKDVSIKSIRLNYP